MHYHSCEFATVRVTDNNGLLVHSLLRILAPSFHTASASIDVTVESINNPPTPDFDVDWVVNHIDPLTGVLTGSVFVTDPDGDELTYGLAEAPDPAKGTVSVDPTTGDWTYTPTLEARLKASDVNAPVADQIVNFAIAASDGYATRHVFVSPNIPQLHITTIEDVGVNPHGIAITPDGTLAYVANTSTGGDATVVVIDTATNMVIGEPIPLSDLPEVVAVSPDGKHVYVTHRTAQVVMVIKTATTDVASNIGIVSPWSVAASPDGARLYVSSGADKLAVIDTALIGSPTTDPVIATIDVGSVPRGVAVSPDSGRIYVVNRDDNTVSVIDTTLIDSGGDPVVATIDVRMTPLAVAVSPESPRAYVASASGTVSVIDTASNMVIGDPIDVGNGPTSLTVSPDGAYVYVVNSSSDTVSVIDTGTNEVISTIGVGIGPQGVAVGPDGTQVYVTNAAEGTVSVITLLPAASMTV